MMSALFSSRSGKSLIAALAVAGLWSMAANAEGPAAPGSFKPAAGWGTVKGRFVWSGEIPAPKQLSVEKDKEWCLGAGPINDEALVIDPATKGVRDVFVYLKKPSAIHPDLPKDAAAAKAAAEAEFQKLNGFAWAELNDRVTAKKVKLEDLKYGAMIDQLRCKYHPHALAVQEGTPILVLNKEPIAHNVKVDSLNPSNAANPLMPANTHAMFDWKADNNPLAIGCSIHGWMMMRAMCFDHPYFTISKTDGSFEIKNVPAGEITILGRREKYINLETGKVGNARGNKLTIGDGETKELGEIKLEQ